MLEITYDDNGLYEALDPKLVDRAMLIGLNKTLKKAEVKLVAFLYKKYNLKKKDIRKVIKIRKAKKGYLVAMIKAVGRRTSLFKFGGRVTKKGVISVQVKRVGGRKKVKGNPKLKGKPFVLTMKSGHKGIYQRIPGTQMPSKKYKREQIAELESISIPQVMITDEAWEIIKKTVDDNLSLEFGRAYDYLFERAAKRAQSRRRK